MQHSSLVPQCITSLYLLTHAGTDHDADSMMHDGPRIPPVPARLPEVKVSWAPQRNHRGAKFANKTLPLPITKC